MKVRCFTAIQTSPMTLTASLLSNRGPNVCVTWKRIFNADGTSLPQWILVLAGLSDLNRPADKLSVTQNVALMATGAIWTRWCMIIKPKNVLYVPLKPHPFVDLLAGTVLQLSPRLYSLFCISPLTILFSRLQAGNSELFRWMRRCYSSCPHFFIQTQPPPLGSDSPGRYNCRKDGRCCNESRVCYEDRINPCPI